MAALYANQSAGPAAASRTNFMMAIRDEVVGSLSAPFLRSRHKCELTITAATTITPARNQPSYRVRHAAIKHSPHLVRAFAFPRTNSLKYTTAQMKTARYSDSPMAVVCM